jgi:hypothetical protein
MSKYRHLAIDIWPQASTQSSVTKKKQAYPASGTHQR